MVERARDAKRRIPGRDPDALSSKAYAILLLRNTESGVSGGSVSERELEKAEDAEGPDLVGQPEHPRSRSASAASRFVASASPVHARTKQ